ncbi:MAG: hypothetical protein ABI175_28225 [Polyangiales bacterium]
MRLVGSLVVHAVIGVVLVALTRHPAPPASSPRVAVEVVDLQLPPAPVTTVDVTMTADRSPGGGAGASARTSEPVRTIVASRARAASRSAADTTATDAFEDPRGAITFEGNEPATSGGGGGTGTGEGTGRGAGIGFGDGGGITAGAPPPPPPPAPKLSKARPARLIFPTRQREVDDGELYVMRVTVDADGFVAGATLVRGFGGRRDEVASSQIWRFRYDPARDDDGAPVRSVLEQRFLVQ